jgi:hypothetical protein
MDQNTPQIGQSRFAAGAGQGTDAPGEEFLTAFVVAILSKGHGFVPEEDVVVKENIRTLKSCVIKPPELPDAPLGLGRENFRRLTSEAVVGVTCRQGVHLLKK